MASVAGMSALGASGMAFSEGLAFNPNEANSRPADLKITDMRGATVAAQYDWPIIKIYTNQGIVGLGEVRDAGWIAQALMLKPYLIGKNPLEIEPLLASIRHLAGTGRYAGGYCAVDIALMDIAGKALGMPCWKLLGDKVRDEVEVYADTPAVEDFSNFEGVMKRRLDYGTKHFKLDLRPHLIEDIPGAYVGNLPTRKGLEIWGEHVLAARDVIGYKRELGADHFGNMTVQSGIELGNFMADSKYSLAYIEDVIHYSRWNAVNLNKEITEGSHTPTLNGEDIFGLPNFMLYIVNNALDQIHPDMLSSGGMIETKKIADLAYQFGISTKFHCASSPIGTMANVHTAATIKEFTSLEDHSMDMPWINDIISGVPDPYVQNGAIKVPDSPGLGIELIEEELEKYLRKDKYLAYPSGLFKPTPEFDEPRTTAELKEKGLIGGYHQTNQGWWHINEEGEYAFQLSSS